MALLEQSPFQFDFFEAVRWIEALHPGRQSIGRSLRLRDDTVRFGQEPHMGFAPRAIAKFEVPNDYAQPYRMLVYFMGLLGPNGPLPLHLTDYVRSRLADKDSALVHFLDIFHHRMISLFYRAWAINQQTLDKGESDAGFSTYIGSLIGIGMPSFRGRDRVPDIAKLHYSGRLLPQVKNADGLEAILSGFFGMPAEIKELTGYWIRIYQDDQDCSQVADCDARTLLGSYSKDSGRLGKTAVLGSKVWICQQSFTVRMGPMELNEYESLLPIGMNLGKLVDWVRNYTCDQWDFSVQPVLKAAEVPGLELGRPEHKPRLGWTTWLQSNPRQVDAADLKMYCCCTV